MVLFSCARVWAFFVLPAHDGPELTIASRAGLCHGTVASITLGRGWALFQIRTSGGYRLTRGHGRGDFQEESAIIRIAFGECYKHCMICGFSGPVGLDGELENVLFLFHDSIYFEVFGAVRRLSFFAVGNIVTEALPPHISRLATFKALANFIGFGYSALDPSWYSMETLRQRNLDAEQGVAAQPLFAASVVSKGWSGALIAVAALGRSRNNELRHPPAQPQVSH